MTFTMKQQHAHLGLCIEDPKKTEKFCELADEADDLREAIENLIQDTESIIGGAYQLGAHSTVIDYRAIKRQLELIEKSL